MHHIITSLILFIFSSIHITTETCNIQQKDIYLTDQSISLREQNITHYNIQNKHNLLHVCINVGITHPIFVWITQKKKALTTKGTCNKDDNSSKASVAVFGWACKTNIIKWCLSNFICTRTCVTTVARKRSLSFCWKCWWKVTANHITGTLRMWLCMKRHCKIVVWCTQNVRRYCSSLTWHQASNNKLAL